MEGIQQQKQAGQEKERLRDIDERKLRVSERGIELREAEAGKEEEPLVLPPDMVQQATEYFKITPESCQGLYKNIKYSII